MGDSFILFIIGSCSRFRHGSKVNLRFLPKNVFGAEVVFFLVVAADQKISLRSSQKLVLFVVLRPWLRALV